jgi:L-2-hydroxyglutarate oxidase LhgO
MKVDCAIIGGGIVGLSVGMALLKSQPGVKLLLLEKENALATHQTGRNSGVIHAGIYYKPGSLKARFACEGNRSMVAFCQQHGIAHEVCGKMIVATDEKELPVLDNLYRRGLENGLDVFQVDGEQIKEVEPHVRCLRGLRVPATGIVSFRNVCEKFRSDLIDGSATFTIATSRMTMNCAVTMSARASQRRSALSAPTEEEAIYRSLQSWYGTTIARHHTLLRYTPS